MKITLAQKMPLNLAQIMTVKDPKLGPDKVDTNIYVCIYIYLYLYVRNISIILSLSLYIYIYADALEFWAKNWYLKPFPIPTCLHRVFLRFQSEGKPTLATMSYAILGQKLQTNKNSGSNLLWGWKCQIQSMA